MIFLSTNRFRAKTKSLKFFYEKCFLSWPILSSLLALGFLFPFNSEAEDPYPNRPIRIIVPTAAGGPSDTSSRLIANELTKRWGKQVMVDNRAGAGTLIGTDLVAKSPPDGYTLLAAPGAIATNPSSYKKLPYDTLRDFTPITQTLYVPNLILIHPSLPVKDLRQFIAFAKARPGELMYASAGFGTNPHLTMELLTNMAHIQLTHVAFKGSAPGLVELLAGRVVASASSAFPLIMPHLKTGKLRSLAITTRTRSEALPDIPTVDEAGLPGYEAVQWSALMAPAGTPTEVIHRLNKEVVDILKLKEVKEHLAKDSAIVLGSSAEEFAVFLKAEIIKWAKVAKVAGIKAE